MPFSLAHLFIVASCIPVMVALAVLGVRWRGTDRGGRLHRAWAWTVIAVQLANIVFYLIPANLTPGTSLPLHICDIAGIIAVAGLLSNQRVFRTIVYYWGIGLCTQAFVTPTIDTGPETMKFWLFWASHFTIVGTAIYDIAARGYRPGWRDLFWITGMLLAWGALVVPLDIATGWNYGYVGNTRPENPTLVDRLGPWPLRLVWMFLITETVFVIMTIIWLPWRKRVPAADSNIP